MVLLVVGKVAPDLIGKHNNLLGYTEQDYLTLIKILFGTKKLLVTPSILTETSNLLGQIGDPHKTRLFEGFKTVIRAMEVIEEIYVPSSVAANRPEFVRLGLTDAGTLVDHDSHFVLLTADAKLYVAAHAVGRAAENFNHYRTLN